MNIEIPGPDSGDCSECGERVPIDKTRPGATLYCPNCGATVTVDG